MVSQARCLLILKSESSVERKASFLFCRPAAGTSHILSLTERGVMLWMEEEGEEDQSGEDAEQVRTGGRPDERNKR